MFKKKSLGQHFLRSAHYLSLIAEAARIREGERVLEIGPGDGALTEALLARGARVVAVEKDARLIPVLKETFAQEIDEGRFSLIEGDALEFTPKELDIKGRYKIVANIPYYITGLLLRKFFSGAHLPELIVLLVQKEVAVRIAREEKESVLSLSVKAYGKPKLAASVPRGAFAPPPTVDSAILLVSDVSRKNFKTEAEEKRFFELVKTGFGQKRKLLRKNLQKLLGSNADALFAEAGIAPNARAEDVALEAWLALAKNS